MRYQGRLAWAEKWIDVGLHRERRVLLLPYIGYEKPFRPKSADLDIHVQFIPNSYSITHTMTAVSAHVTYGRS